MPRAAQRGHRAGAQDDMSFRDGLCFSEYSQDAFHMEARKSFRFAPAPARSASPRALSTVHAVTAARAPVALS